MCVVVWGLWLIPINKASFSRFWTANCLLNCQAGNCSCWTFVLSLPADRRSRCQRLEIQNVAWSLLRPSCIVRKWNHLKSFKHRSHATHRIRKSSGPDFDQNPKTLESKTDSEVSTRHDMPSDDLSESAEDSNMSQSSSFEPVPKTTCVSSETRAVDKCHVDDRSSVPIRCRQCLPDSGKPRASPQEDVLRGVESADHSVRGSQEGAEVWTGSAEGSNLLPMVPEEMGQQSQSRTPYVLPIPDDVGGAQRSHIGLREPRRTTDWKPSSKFQCVPQGQGQELWETIDATHSNRSRTGRRRMLGSSHWATWEHQGGRERPEARSSGRGTERSGESIEDVVPAHHRSSELQLATNAETFLIEQCIREYNHFHNNPGNNNHPVFVGQTRQPYQQNMILKEMM